MKGRGKDMTAFQEVLRGDEGASMVEYGLLVGLIALAAVSSVTTLGTSVMNLFSNIASNL